MRNIGDLEKQKFDDVGRVRTALDPDYPLLEASDNESKSVYTYDLRTSQLLEEILKELKHIKTHLYIITNEELKDGDDD